MSGHANPDEETTDWRAVCGRTACTVRRAGRARALSDPYQSLFPVSPSSVWPLDTRQSSSKEGQQSSVITASFFPLP